jgi:hypothetical protein
MPRRKMRAARHSAPIATLSGREQHRPIIGQIRRAAKVGSKRPRDSIVDSSRLAEPASATAAR